MKQLFRLGDLQKDTRLYEEVFRLHQLTVVARWILVLLLWSTVGLFSLWRLRHNIDLAFEYFTWASVRYGLRYHYAAAIGLTFCVAMTFAVLLWQSRNILLGISQKEQEQLVARVHKIREQGASHPLWLWVCEGKKIRQSRRGRQNNT